ncbi:tissue factor pathway inhibitor-like isoform X2 [Mercenaria mercenaria]|nr:tissue factor pathway inhibitor-like isoform X2 [Mercenaria mercenaria]
MDIMHYALVVLCCMNFVTCNTNSEIRSGKLQREAPECSLQKDKGGKDCSKSTRKFYFDSSTGACREFNYTGCGGNLNNFISLDRCNSRCVCSNPRDNGEGPKRMTRYFYNAETEKCQSFKYRGSGGNANGFLSFSQCQNVCERVALRRKCNVRPEVGTDCNNNSTVQFYYDKPCDCCRKFTYLGCGGNQNRFPTRQRCVQKCKLEEPAAPALSTRPARPALCSFQNVYGDCSGSFTRYFYDSRLDRCVPFTYSGCGGNQNNFLNLRMCKNTCDNDSKFSSSVKTVTLSDKKDTESSEPVTKSPNSSSKKSKTTTLSTRITTSEVPKICKNKPARGFCIFNIIKYYYDTLSGKCKSFIWTGCGGNENRFISQNECERTCMTL